MVQAPVVQKLDSALRVLNKWGQGLFSADRGQTKNIANI